MTTARNDTQAVGREMRLVLLSASVLVFVLGAILFVFPASTARYFAWTINPPVTAAFIGSGFLAAGVLELRSARERTWSIARTGYSAVLAFTVVMLVVTLYHIDRFHTGEPQAWIWIAVYVAFPPLMLFALFRQLRIPGRDNAIVSPLPQWFRATIALQAIVLIGVGLLLLSVPLTVADYWPWQLSALTGRAIGAWLVGFGFAAGQSAIERDMIRVRNVALSSVVFAMLLFLAIARYRHQIAWGELTTWLFVVVAGSLLLVGIYCVAASYRRLGPVASA